MRNKELKRTAFLLGICMTTTGLAQASSLDYLDDTQYIEYNIKSIEEVIAAEVGTPMEYDTKIIQQETTTPSAFSINGKMVVDNYQEDIWDGSTLQPVTENFQGVYEINNAAQLAWISEQSNTQSMGLISIKLMKDIDLGGKEWTPINKKFNTGTIRIEGNNHTISNLTCNAGNDLEYVGLIGGTKCGEVKNLTLENINLSSKRQGGTEIGGIAGFFNYADIKNCHVTGDIFYERTMDDPSMKDGVGSVGGVIGTMFGHNGWNPTNITIKNVTSDVNITVSSSEQGLCAGSYGLVFGSVTGEDVLIESIQANGSIEEKNYLRSGDRIAGLVGEFVGVRAQIKKCKINMTVNTPGSNISPETLRGSASGLIGILFGEGQISDCEIDTTINAPYSAVGGITSGIAESNSGACKPSLKIEKCTVNGELKGKTVGGIIDHGWNDLSISNCHNSAKITGKRAGGIVGFCADTTIIDSSNTGDISAATAGGIAGEGDFKGERLVNLGKIKGHLIGGIIGYSVKLELNDSFNAGNLESKRYDDKELYIGYISLDKTLRAGGLTGGTRETDIRRCYSSASYIPNNEQNVSMGGVIGSLKDNNYNLKLDSIYFLVGEDINLDKASTGMELTETQCKPLTFVDMGKTSSFEGWDLKKTWQIDPDKNNGMPYLRSLPNLINNDTEYKPEISPGISEGDKSFDLSQDQINIGDEMIFNVTLEEGLKEVFLQFSNPLNNDEWFSLENCKAQFMMKDEGNGHYTMTRAINTLGTRRVRVVYKDSSGQIKYGKDEKVFEVVDLNKGGAKINIQARPLIGKANQLYTFTVKSDKKLTDIKIQMDNPLQGGDWISLQNAISMEECTYVEIPAPYLDEYRHQYTFANYPIYTPGNESDDYKRKYRLVYTLEGESEKFVSDTKEIIINPSIVTEKLDTVPNNLYHGEPFKMRIEFETMPKEVKCHILGRELVDMTYDSQEGCYIGDASALSKGSYEAYVSYTDSNNQISQTAPIKFEVLQGRAATLKTDTKNYTGDMLHPIQLKGIITSETPIKKVYLEIRDKDNKLITDKIDKIKESDVKSYDLSKDIMTIYTDDAAFEKAANYDVVVKVESEGRGMHIVDTLLLTLSDYTSYLNKVGADLKLTYIAGDDKNNINHSIGLYMGETGKYGVEWRSSCPNVLAIKDGKAERQDEIREDKEVVLEAIPYLYKNNKLFEGHKVSFNVIVKKDSVIEQESLTDEDDKNIQEGENLIYENHKNTQEEEADRQLRKEINDFKKTTYSVINDMISAENDGYMGDNSYRVFGESVLNENNKFNYQKVFRNGYVKGEWNKTPYDEVQLVFAELYNLEGGSVDKAREEALTDIIIGASLEQAKSKMEGSLGGELGSYGLEKILGKEGESRFVEELRHQVQEDIEVFNAMIENIDDQDLKKQLQEMITVREGEEYLKKQVEDFLKSGIEEQLIELRDDYIDVILELCKDKKVLKNLTVSQLKETAEIINLKTKATLLFSRCLVIGLTTEAIDIEYTNKAATLYILRSETINTLDELIKKYNTTSDLNQKVEQQKVIDGVVKQILEIDELGTEYSIQHAIENGSFSAELGLTMDATTYQHTSPGEPYDPEFKHRTKVKEKQALREFLEVKEKIKKDSFAINVEKYRKLLIDKGFKEAKIDVINDNNKYKIKLNEFKAIMNK